MASVILIRIFGQYLASASASGLDDEAGDVVSLVSSSQVPGFTDSDVDDDAKFEAKLSEAMKGSGFKLVVRNIPLDWSGQQLEQYIYNLDNDIEINHIGVTRQRAARK